MKKKIALALAAVMTFAAAVPMNLFAASRNGTTGVLDYSYNDGTLLPAASLDLDIYARELNGNLANGGNLLANSGRGVNLVVGFENGDNIVSGSRGFQIELDGAEWDYYENANGVIRNGDGTVYNTSYDEIWFDRIAANRYQTAGVQVAEAGPAADNQDVLDANLAQAQRVTTALTTILTESNYDTGTTISTDSFDAAVSLALFGVKTEDAWLMTSGMNLVTDNAQIIQYYGFLKTPETFLTALRAAAKQVLMARLNAITNLTAADLAIIENVIDRHVLVFSTDPTSNTTNDLVGTANNNGFTTTAGGTGISTADTTQWDTSATPTSIEGFFAAVVAGTSNYHAAQYFNDYAGLIPFASTAGAPNTDKIFIDATGTDSAFVDTPEGGNVKAAFPADTEWVPTDNTVKARVATGYYRLANGIAENWMQSSTANPARAYGYEITFDPNNKKLAQVNYWGTVPSRAAIVVPLVIRTKGTGEVSATITRTGSSTVTSQKIVIANAGGIGTDVTAKSIATGRNRIYLDRIVIAEKNLNAVGASGVITLTAPVGYHFVNNSLNSGNYATLATRIGFANFSSTISVHSNESKVTNRSVTNELRIAYTVNTSTITPGEIYIDNLVIAPDDPDTIEFYDVINQTGTTLKLRLQGDAASRIKTDGVDIDVARRVAWDISYTSDFADNKAAQNLLSGRRDQKAAKVVFEERTLDAWWSEKETPFTLVDADNNVLSDVKISKVDIKTSEVTNGFESTFENDPSDSNIKNYPKVIWNNNGNGFSLIDLIVADRKLAKLEITPYLSADANFSGDVYLRVYDGDDTTSQSSVQDNGIVKIANFTPSVEITTGTQEIQIGYQTVEVADITLSEPWVGAWKKGAVELTLGEYGTGIVSPYMYFAPVKAGDVTLNSGTMMKISSVKATNKTLSFNVDRTSGTTGSYYSTKGAAEVTIKNAIVNIDRTVPYGDYDLIVGGNAIVDNYTLDEAGGSTWKYIGDFFPVAGRVEADYISVVTMGANKPFTDKVEIIVGTNNVRVNGVEKEMDAPSYIKEETGRTMVPLRFVSEALGVDKNNVLWDEVSRTATIFTAEKTVAFTEGSAVMTINGNPFTVQNEDGTLVIPEINADNDRMYIPFRAFGEALGIAVDYVNDIPTYNPEKIIDTDDADEE